MAEYNILFADSDLDNARSIAGLLRTNGFNAESVTTGTEALDLYQSQTPDLVITDLILDDKDGMYELMIAFDGIRGPLALRYKIANPN